MSRLQTYFSSEFIASGQGTEFHEFITRITQAKSKSEETSHVTEELSKLTRSMGSPDISSTRMRDYLTRLIHCYMLGYSVDFSIIYAIMASQSGESVMDKRVGYLACTLFLQRNNELGIMLINTLQRDLKSQNYLDVCAALNALCYLQQPEMLDSLLDLVIATMTFPKQVVRKKAVMALYFLYTRCTIDRLEAPLRQALEDKDFSVVFAALSVWKLILVDHAEQFGDLLPVVFRIHRQLIEKRIHKSFVYHGMYAPWAHMDCLAIYSIYLQLNIGSPKEVYDIVMECVHTMEKKVDAAFAVVLECIKLLSDMDPILLSCYSPDESPFVVLEPFLNASNLNLKYLGLIGMSYVDVSLWRPRWLDGSLIGDTVASAPFDETIVTQAMENLDMVMHREILMNTSPALIDACAQSTKLAYWLLNRLNEHVDRNAWYIETVMQIMAVTEKRLDDDYVETQCSLLKEALLGEIQETTKRECSVKVAYDLLKNTHGDTIPPLLLQFAFWTLGEHGYLSSLSSDIDRMTQLIKWLRLLHDDDLQTCALQAIKRCILRSKTWLSGLEPILKEYKKSPVPEKQQISREISDMMKDVEFEKHLQETDVTLSTMAISANPNRPKSVNPFLTNDDFHTDHPRGTLSINVQQQDTIGITQGICQGHHEGDTEAFGKRWVALTKEEKQKFECSVTESEKLARRLGKLWHLNVIQVIGQEFIAVETDSASADSGSISISISSVLIHVAMLPRHQIQLTIRAETDEAIQSFKRRGSIQ